MITRLCHNYILTTTDRHHNRVTDTQIHCPINLQGGPKKSEPQMLYT